MPRRKVEVEVEVKKKPKKVEKKVEEEAMDFEKELKDILERMEKITDKIKLEESKKEDKVMEEARENIVEQSKRAKECMIFASEKGSMLVGEQTYILASFATMIHSIVKEGSLDLEELISAFVHGYADETGDGYCNRQRLNEILEVIKEEL